MTLEQIGELFDRIRECYPHFDGDLQKMKTWHEILRNVPYQTAVTNLHRHASEPANRFPPHPGALLAESEVYHEAMVNAGKNAIEEHDRFKQTAVPPTPEQSRKVREIFDRTN